MVDAKTLTAVTPPRVIQVTQSIVWERKGQSLLQSDIEIGLLPGKYDLQLGDATGTYFLGPVTATYLKTGRAGYAVFRGGVSIPAKPEARPRFLAVEEGNPRRGASLAEAINAAPPGATTWPPAVALVEVWAVESNRGNLVLFQEIEDDAVIAKLKQLFGS